MVNETILTIGILAYNRGKYINLSLDAIVGQMADNDPGEVEILISDNASTDNTEDLVKPYKKRYPKLITYYKNPENVFTDQHMDLVVQRARGKYVWLLGCEDIPKKGAIREILGKVSEDTYDNILLNFETFSETTNKIQCGNVLGISKDEIFSSMNELLKGTNGPDPAISANVVLRKSWLKAMEKPLLFKGWGHIERIFDMMIGSGHMKTLRMSFICFTLLRGGNEWWDTELVFINFISYVKVFKNLAKKGLPADLAKYLVYKHSRMHFFRSIVNAKQAGLGFSVRRIADTVSLFSAFPLSYIIGLPMMLIPKQIFSLTIVRKIISRLNEIFYGNDI